MWEKSHALALDIFRRSERLPCRRGLALNSQLRRSALSIPANIAEGAGKVSSAEFYRSLQIALGSASETLYHLLLARDTGVVTSDQYDALSDRDVEVRRMLTGLSKKIGSRSAVAATPFVPFSPPRDAR